MNRIGVIIVTLLIIVMVGSTMVYTVDARKIAVVYEFGAVREVINAPVDVHRTSLRDYIQCDEPADGRAPTCTTTLEIMDEEARDNAPGAGLHFKLPPPFNTVRFIDRRIQTLDNATPNEVYTRETNMGLVVDWFVKWRVVDAKAFIRFTGGTDIKAAEERLASNVRRIFDVEVASRREVQAVLDSDRQAIMMAVINGLESTAREMGVEIVDVRMRRVDYSASTAPKIFDQMITERRIVADRLRAEGNAENERIRADADRQYEVVVSRAYRDAQNIMGKGDAEVARLFADAFGKDPAFADFYRSLQAYRESFNSKSDVMLLDPHSDFFRFMRSSTAPEPSNP